MTRKKDLAIPPPDLSHIEAEQKCYTPAEAAVLLGVTENWVTEAVKFRRIPFTRVGRFTRFQLKHIRAITEPNEYDPAARGRKTPAAA